MDGWLWRDRTQSALPDTQLSVRLLGDKLVYDVFDFKPVTFEAFQKLYQSETSAPVTEEELKAVQMLLKRTKDHRNGIEPALRRRMLQ
jgi:hypothetical protein